MATHSRGVEVVHVVLDLVGRLAVEDALVQPEHVAGREDDAEGGEDGPAEVGLAAPCSTRNSPTKLFSSGRPMLASVVMRKTVESQGAAVATPP